MPASLDAAHNLARLLVGEMQTRRMLFKRLTFEHCRGLKDFAEIALEPGY